MSDLPVGTIVFEGVSKRYRLGALGTLRSTVAALASRGRDGGGPLFLGGNSLGILSHPGKYDTLFIPEEKLPKQKDEKERRTAFISQSGAYMITRMSFLYAHAPLALEIVAIVGALTAIFAASIGLVQNEGKRILAYSTVSQLGYMFLAVGLGAYSAGMFHLTTHAFFKACLFLGAGSVMHALGEHQDVDIRKAGQLKRVLRITAPTFLIASLAISGIPLFAGFFSKDEILWKALEAGGLGRVLWFVGAAAAFMTAFYMFRAIYMTFHGEYRGGDESGDYKHTHESPWVMVGPLVFLAILAVIAGWWNIAGGYNELMGHHGEHVAHSFFGGLFAPFTHVLPVIALVVGLFGIFMAYVIFCAKWITAESVGRAFGPLYTLVFRKYFFDELYENLIVKLALMKGLFTGFTLFDNKGVDGAVNGVSDVIISGGRAIRHAQTGQLQLYGLIMGIGVAIIGLCVYFFG